MLQALALRRLLDSVCCVWTFPLLPIAILHPRTQPVLHSGAAAGAEDAAD